MAKYVAMQVVPASVKKLAYEHDDDVVQLMLDPFIKGQNIKRLSPWKIEWHEITQEEFDLWVSATAKAAEEGDVVVPIETIKSMCPFLPGDWRIRAICDAEQPEQEKTENV